MPNTPQNPGQPIALSSLRMDGGTQLRVATHEETLQQYTDAIREGATFPPVVVFFDGKDHWLADGFHTCEAHRRAKKSKVLADIRKGTQRDAILYAAGANQEHGLRRSDADKRRAVEALLNDEEWAKWSDREIARQCKVSPTLVGAVRKDLSVHRGQMGEPTGERKATRKGTTYTVQTKKIGKSEPAAHIEPKTSPAILNAISTTVQTEPVAAIVLDREERQKLEHDERARGIWLGRLEVLVRWVEESVATRPDNYLAWYGEPGAPGADTKISAQDIMEAAWQLHRVARCTFRDDLLAKPPSKPAHEILSPVLDAAMQAAEESEVGVVEKMLAAANAFAITLRRTLTRKQIEAAGGDPTKLEKLQLNGYCPVDSIVYHAAYGVGRVIDLQGAGKTRKIVIRFLSGEHKFEAAHVNLEIVRPSD